MSNQEQLRSWRGRTVIDREGKRIGELVEVFLDDRDEAPWGAVRTDAHDGRLSLAPLTGASPRGRELRLTASRRRVFDAPTFADGASATADEERTVFGHYGCAYDVELRRVA